MDKAVDCGDNREYNYSMQSTTPRFVFGGVDLYKTLRVGLVMALGTLLTYFLSTVIPAMHVDGGSALTITIVTTLLEAARRWATNYQG